MAMTDPIADMLTRIRNAARAGHESLEMPASRVKEAILKVLVQEGYLLDFKRVKAKDGGGEALRVQLRFDRGRKPIMAGLRRISRPGRRVYVGIEQIPPLRAGLGVHILSTCKGILADRDAKKKKVGGEIICSVW